MYIEVGSESAFLNADMVTVVYTQQGRVLIEMGTGWRAFHEDRVPPDSAEAVVVDILRELGKPRQSGTQVITFLNGQVVTRSLQ